MSERDSEVLAREFHKAMVRIYLQAKADYNYTPQYFMNMVAHRGGVDAAKHLLRDRDPQAGLTKLWELGALDISMEQVVLDTEFRPLFTREERATARQRLKQMGYEPHAEEFHEI
jgi:hypothetical protein